MKRIVAPFLLASLPMSVNAAPRASGALRQTRRADFLKGLAARFSRRDDGCNVGGGT
jgi:hypothetical protein